MIKRVIISILVLLNIGSIGALCASDYNQNHIYYRSGEMREIDDTLYVKVVVEVVGKALPKYEALKLTPKLTTESKSLQLPDLLMLGSNKKRVYRRAMKLMSKSELNEVDSPTQCVAVTKDGDYRFDYMTQIGYEEWMDDARMVLYVENLMPANDNVLLIISLAEKVQLSVREPYEVQAKVNYVKPEAEEKIRKKQGQAFIDFQVGRSNIVPTFRRNPEELQKVEQALNEVVNNPDVKVNGLYIEGYASPDGSYAVNERLSRERSVAMKEYIMNKVRLPIEPSKIVVSSVAEDWDGLRIAVEGSDLAAKKQVLDIIDETSDVEQRKAKLKLFGGTYQTLLREYFPQLRRVEYQIDFSIKDFTVEESKRAIDKKEIEFLSQKELFEVAFDYGEGTKEFEQIMLHYIPRQYPNDPVANINFAAAMIDRGEFVTATRYLSQYEESAKAWNNLGVIKMLNGELDEAQLLFEKAKAEGVAEAEHNLVELNKKREDNVRQERYRSR